MTAAFVFWPARDLPRRVPRIGVAGFIYGLLFCGVSGAVTWLRGWICAGPCEQGAKVRRVTEPTLRGAAASPVLRWGCWRWRFCRGVVCRRGRRCVLCQLWGLFLSRGIPRAVFRAGRADRG